MSSQQNKSMKSEQTLLKQRNGGESNTRISLGANRERNETINQKNIKNIR